MASFQQDIADIYTKLQGAIGSRAWGVEHGIGTFITIEFGESVPPKYANGKAHGEWHLWVYGGVWRLEKERHVIVAAGDDRKKIEAEIRCIEGCILQSFEIITPALDALLTFENEIVLRIFSIYSKETDDNGIDNWRLYTPDSEKVITVHPGGKWSYDL